MKFLVFVTPPSIYHGCSNQKTFWEEKFKGKKDFFQSVNKKIGRSLHTVHAVIHKEIVMGAMCSAAGVLKDTLMVN